MSANVVAIDGPAYVGKSVIAKALSQLTGYAVINTGHMYRAVARIAMEKGLTPADEHLILACARGVRIGFQRKDKEWLTMVNGEDWTHALDNGKIVLFSSKIACIAELRQMLTALQLEYAKSQTIIMEGRDIGSLVFPDALWKFFITASLEVRAKRMCKMMQEDERRAHPDVNMLIPRIQEIDYADRNRKIAPLIEAPDAIVYDNSDSPSGMQDALVLQYYIHHAQEIIRNVETLKKKGMVGSGKYR